MEQDSVHRELRTDADGQRGEQVDVYTQEERSYRAAAPEMISISSLVITAWRVRLKVRVNLSIISAVGAKYKNILYIKLMFTGHL